MMVKIRFGLFIPKPNCLILHFPKNLEAMFSRNLIYLGVETKKESKHIYAYVTILESANIYFHRHQNGFISKIKYIRHQ